MTCISKPEFLLPCVHSITSYTDMIPMTFLTPNLQNSICLFMKVMVVSPEFLVMDQQMQWNGGVQTNAIIPLLSRCGRIIRQNLYVVDCNSTPLLLVSEFMDKNQPHDCLYGGEYTDREVHKRGAHTGKYTNGQLSSNCMSVSRCCFAAPALPVISANLRVNHTFLSVSPNFWKRML